MNLVDSCGWLEYFAGTEKGRRYSKPLSDTETLIVPTICLFEVFKKIAQQHGEGEALRMIASMRQGIVVDLGPELAIEAAMISRDQKLPMADAIVVATAQANSATIWTQDSHLKHQKGVRFID